MYSRVTTSSFLPLVLSTIFAAPKNLPFLHDLYKFQLLRVQIHHKIKFADERKRTRRDDCTERMRPWDCDGNGEVQTGINLKEAIQKP